MGTARRNFLVAAGALLGAPRIFAQTVKPAAEISRVGMLFSGSAASAKTHEDAFVHELSALGYKEGINVVFHRYYADGDISRLPGLTDQLVRSRPDVIFAPTAAATDAVQKATSTIPIVFSLHTDPLGRGTVASLARPGANTTGFGNVNTELVAKRLDLLQEILPRLKRLGSLGDSSVFARGQLARLRDHAARLGIQVVASEPDPNQNYDQVLAAIQRARVEALFVIPSIRNANNRRRIAEFATSQRLPTVHGDAEMVEAGGLVSYAADHKDLARKAAGYVDRILKGVKPGDLPVQMPTKFELVVNARTAKELGIVIPQSILLRADRVIE